MHKKPPNTFSVGWTMMKEYKFYRHLPKVVTKTLKLKKHPDVKEKNFETFLPVGSQAPDFELSSLDGEKVRLSEFRGQYVVLEFGAYT
jgi:cytochrome oxidase Cu insertion factor (SCO1/SenC/PrrC family)